MTVVTEYCEVRDFNVRASNQPYDLSCTNGPESVDVEVKGTTTLGETVLLTPREVQHGLATFPRTALAVVHGIALHDAGTPSPSASGGMLEIHQPWRPLDVDLKPVGYTYTVPVIERPS